MKRWLRAAGARTWSLGVAAWPVARVVLLAWIVLGWVVLIPLAFYLGSPPR